MDMSAVATSAGRFSKPLPSDSSTSDMANDDWLLFPELVGMGSMSLPPDSVACCSPDMIGEFVTDVGEIVGDIESLCSELPSSSESAPPPPEKRAGSEKSGNASSAMVVATDRRCEGLATTAAFASITSSATRGYLTTREER